MNFRKKELKANKSLIFAFLTITLIVFGFSFKTEVKQAKAYLNMVSGGSFEDNIEEHWTSYQAESSSRDYDVYRSYDAAYGYGSHSVAIRANTGSAEEFWTANFQPREDNNEISLEADTTYYLAFYIKGSTNTQTRVIMSDTNNYEPVDGFRDIAVSQSWERHVLPFYSNSNTGGTFSFSYGNLPEGQEIYIDGVQLFEEEVDVLTGKINGTVGQTNKFVRVNNISFFTQEEIEVELPYYNEDTSSPGRRRFSPESMNANGFYMNIYEGTYSGIGQVYANGDLMGEFDYEVIPVIRDFFPTLLHVDEDLAINGSGFNPQVDIDKMYVVIRTMDVSGANYDHYIKPHIIDPKLKQVVVDLPVGVVNGAIYIQTSYRNAAGEDIVQRSNSLRYEVKPIIYGSEWSKEGYEQVGDKLRIYGKGIANRPVVNFYNQNNEKVASKRAELIEMGAEEVIEVATPLNINMLNITVQVGRVESDIAGAITYAAKPKMNRINTAKNRFMSGSENTVPAAKTGEEITIYGNSLYSDTATSAIEFQGLGQRRIVVDPSEHDPRGSWLKVIVPEGAQNGYINVEINGQKSNYMALEVIPTLIELQPTEIVPGELVSIRAGGVGSVLGLTRVYFSTGNDKIEVMPESVEHDGDVAVISVRAPLAISSDSTTINIQYDKWLDDSSPVLNVSPYISSASMDIDSRILVIKGYGFSIHPRENEITYRYADENQTEIDPRVRVLGVYPTEEGQEIRIQVQDDYHYGYVQVSVGGRESNEYNFGPVSIRSISKRVQYVESEERQMGVIYISGYNLGENGGVRVGENWADVHYRTNFFIIAVVPEENVNDGPIIVTREQ